MKDDTFADRMTAQQRFKLWAFRRSVAVTWQFVFGGKYAVVTLVYRGQGSIGTDPKVPFYIGHKTKSLRDVFRWHGSKIHEEADIMIEENYS